MKNLSNIFRKLKKWKGNRKINIINLQKNEHTQNSNLKKFDKN